MTKPEEHPEDYQFEKLMLLTESGKGGELYARLLHKGPAIFDALANFLIRQPNEPRVAVLLDLMGKLGDARAVTLLMRFLDIEVPELRMAAAVAVGWLQAPAAIEKLDQMEGSDPDPGVRAEARAAIEQILIEYPNLAHLLHHHRCKPAPGAPGAPGELEYRLIHAVPRLIAFNLKVVPLSVTPETRELRVAIRTGSSEENVAKLKQLTGYKIDSTHWTADRIHDAQERLYTLGDDDFCDFLDELPGAIRNELRRLIVAGVRPDEPTCPLDEAQDAVDAVQAFLSLCASSPDTRAVIEYRDRKSLTIRYIPGATEHRLASPAPELRSHFMTALQLAADLYPMPESNHSVSLMEFSDGREMVSVEVSGGTGPHTRRVELVRVR